MITKNFADGDPLNRIKLEKNEDYKNNLYNYEIKPNGMKPSQRIIQNILRKEKEIELYEKSLFDLNE